MAVYPNKLLRALWLALLGALKMAIKSLGDLEVSQTMTDPNAGASKMVGVVGFTRFPNSERFLEPYETASSWGRYGESRWNPGNLEEANPGVDTFLKGVWKKKSLKCHSLFDDILRSGKAAEPKKIVLLVPPCTQHCETRGLEVICTLKWVAEVLEGPNRGRRSMKATSSRLPPKRWLKQNAPKQTHEPG